MKVYILKEAYTHEEMYDVGVSLDVEKLKSLKSAMESRRVHDGYPWYEIHEMEDFSALESLYIKTHPSDPLWNVMYRDGSYKAFQLEFNDELKLVNVIDDVTLRYSVSFMTPDNRVIARAPDEETAIKYGKKLFDTDERSME